MGQPHKIEDLGETEIPQDIFQEYLIDMSPQFRYASWDMYYSRSCVCILINAHLICIQP